MKLKTKYRVKKKPNLAAFVRNNFPSLYVRFAQETNLKCRHIMDMYTLL